MIKSALILPRLALNELVYFVDLNLKINPPLVCLNIKSSTEIRNETATERATNK